MRERRKIVEEIKRKRNWLDTLVIESTGERSIKITGGRGEKIYFYEAPRPVCSLNMVLEDIVEDIEELGYTLWRSEVRGRHRAFVMKRR